MTFSMFSGCNACIRGLIFGVSAQKYELSKQRFS